MRIARSLKTALSLIVMPPPPTLCGERHCGPNRLVRLLPHDDARTFISNHIASEKIICIMIYDRSSERTRNAKFEAWSASVFQTDRETRNRVVFTRRSLPISDYLGSVDSEGQPFAAIASRFRGVVYQLSPKPIAIDHGILAPASTKREGHYRSSLRSGPRSALPP